MEQRMKIAILGLGSRGLDVYAAGIQKYQEKMELAAVADLRPERVEEARRRYGLKKEQCFGSAEELFAAGRLADAMFICTQDQDHVKHAVEALKLGYHLLLEKPISADEQECRFLQETAEKYSRKVCVCHVLRYTPFYGKIREMIADGKLGRVLSVQAREDVGYFHQAHSFVRGNWRNSNETSPMILAKCCHDMDLLVWLTGASCLKLSSFGSLSHFRPDCAPEGAALRCLDGCRVKESCPYDAEKIYITNEKTGVRAGNGWPVNTVVTNPTEESVREALQKGPYGRCVYHCDNNVTDHQVVQLQMERDITITFSMCAFSDRCDRYLKVMGTHGELEGYLSQNRISYTPFGEKTEIIDLTKQTDDFSGHAGGDLRMLEQFADYILKDEKSSSITELATSLESHYMALAAERSRLAGGQVIELK